MEKYFAEMQRLHPGFDENFVWPPTDVQSLDASLCYHARKYLSSVRSLNPDVILPFSVVLDKLERLYQTTKVEWEGFPVDFHKFIRDSVDWNASPGWPWRKQYPTNRDLFLFDGVKCDELRVAMVEAAVKQRWLRLMNGSVSDPIYCFIKQEPHKISKAEKKSWRLISGVGLTDSLIDRILYGKWLDAMITSWPLIPSKAGWNPSGGGYRWLAQTFRGKEPVSIDKSAWDWTVNRWHITIIRNLIPRMIVGITDEWRLVFGNRMLSLFSAGHPRFKPACGCEFIQLVDGIQKSGCLGTIAFNSIWQVAIHLAAGGSEHDVFFSLGDDTVQEYRGRGFEEYIGRLKATGADVKEVDIGFPIKFGGHNITEFASEPAYRNKHLFNLLYLDEKVALETLDSYQHLYALDKPVLRLIHNIILREFGPPHILSEDYLEHWYNAYE